MISQTIRTSKYTTTIDVPAEKLQTKAKFIQIQKNPFQRQEIISIPNPCYGKQQQRRQMNFQTKLMIEQLEQAYNEDVSALQSQISSIKTSYDIERLKYQNQIERVRRQNQNNTKIISSYQVKIQRAQKELKSQVQNLGKIIKSKDQQLLSKQNDLQKMKNQILKLKTEIKEKDSLLSTKFKEFQTEKDRKFYEERRSFQIKIDKITNQSHLLKVSVQEQLKRVQKQNEKLRIQINTLERQVQSNKNQKTQIKKLNDFQNKQIESYIKNLKDLESQKKNIQSKAILLHEKIQQQNHQIERLLEQMRQQRIYIETHVQDRSLDSSQQLKLLTDKIHQYSASLEQKDKQSFQYKTQYLMKLKQIDEERQFSRNLKQQISQANQKIASLNLEIRKLKENQEYLKNELTKKICQYNELLNRPPEHFEVKIQKSIDKKEYINELQIKISQLESIIEQLKVDNESYVEEIRGKVRDELLLKKKEQKLIKSNEELKSYISNREKSIGWAVEREIMKDVEISRNSSQKLNGYKVFVKNSSSQSEKNQSNNDVSGINMGEGINFSVESKIQQILQKKLLSSAIQMSRDQPN